MQAYANKGTLVPGQVITVNQYTVQVEKYLSQGGFAHVYLVRTPQPLFGTTHHVLKRIAVANEAMLTEVKKEVDIMRILRGHPNIVYLIDASWTQMPNGMTEAYVLMEFCQGGGIIDMMNRRLRERLTEAEILTIFVDVCEGVAAMHNLHPPLLHRDLKVENILQSNATSYKLCDFGSSAPVAKPPANTQEIRMVEADLNRHTTLQYRAPEMVDAYLRRPIDEKSDVWALGVLLYKLCYYTTPFEEHGPLAILNVQYRIPPYPTYSNQMNALIGTMLKEHGTQRPSVFEILNVVHGLRGSKSRYTYDVPGPVPLSPRDKALRPPAGPLDGVITYRSRSPTSGRTERTDVDPGAGIQAREKVLEAIAPMRRGRPPAISPAPSGQSPAVPIPANKTASERTLEGLSFGSLDTKAGVKSNLDDAWAVSGSVPKSGLAAGPANGFGDSFTGVTSSSRVPTLPPKPSSAATMSKASNLGLPGSKDAFAGLGLDIADRKAPTLGEARKTRTGLVSMSSYSAPSRERAPSPAMPIGMGATSSTRPPSSLAAPFAATPRATSPRGRPSSMLGPPSPVPLATSAPASTNQTPEERFPSLEDLDRKFGSSSSRSNVPGSIKTADLPPSTSRITTGLAMRDTPKWMTDYSTTALKDAPREPPSPRVGDYLSGRPPLSRKYRSSTNTGSLMLDKPDTGSPLSADLLGTGAAALPAPVATPSRAEPRDWLTGDDDIISPVPDTGALPRRRTGNTEAARATSPVPPGTPVLRESPSKRASYIEGGGMKFQSPKTAEPEQAAPAPGPSQRSRFIPTTSFPTSGRATPGDYVRREHAASPAMAKAKSAGLSAPSSPSKTTKTKSFSPASSDTSDEGPEDLNRTPYRPPVGAKPRSGSRGAGSGGHGERQTSVHKLADRYGAIGGGPRPQPAASGASASGATVQRRRSSVHPSTSAHSSSRAGAHTPQARTPALPARNGSPTKRPASAQHHRKQPSASTLPPPMPGSPRSGSPTKRPPSAQQHRKQPSVSALSPPLSGSPRMATTSSTGAGRARPQSMFLHGDVDAARAAAPTAAIASSPKPMSPGLVAPAMRPQRRNSISDMVQKYESLVATPPAPSSGGPRPPPPVGSKPASLKVASGAPHPSAGERSPSLASAAARFPALSPAASPVLARAELPNASGSARELAPPADDGHAPGRASPVLARRPSPMFGVPSASKRAPSPAPANGTAAAHRSPLPPAADASVQPEPAARSSSGGQSGGARSPSPEKPFQGVGKLIDRWQRNIADANTPTIAGGPRGIPAKRGASGGR